MADQRVSDDYNLFSTQFWLDFLQLPASHLHSSLNILQPAVDTHQLTLLKVSNPPCDVNFYFNFIFSNILTIGGRFPFHLYFQKTDKDQHIFAPDSEC